VFAKEQASIKYNNKNNLIVYINNIIKEILIIAILNIV
jgi:hypothetical protein